jgi:hypothetical protein
MSTFSRFSITALRQTIRTWTDTAAVPSPTLQRAARFCAAAETDLLPLLKSFAAALTAEGLDAMAVSYLTDEDQPAIGLVIEAAEAAITLCPGATPDGFRIVASGGALGSTSLERHLPYRLSQSDGVERELHAVLQRLLLHRPCRY